MQSTIKESTNIKKYAVTLWIAYTLAGCAGSVDTPDMYVSHEQAMMEDKKDDTQNKTPT